MNGNKKTFRAAIVGCGTIAPNHANAICESEHATLVALCDKRPEQAEKLAKSFNLEAEIFTDFDAMLDSIELDAIHICTPHFLHAPMAIKALKRNINVFLEKPMAMTAEEIDAMLEAEAESSAKICVCFQNRKNKITNIAHKVADEDGGVTHAHAALFWNRDERYYTESDWRGKYATEGGGVMINQAIHTIDLLCQFLGKPKSVTATTSNHHLKGIIEVEDTCEGVITFESGKQANFFVTTAFRGPNTTDIFLKTPHHKIDMKQPYIYVDGVEVQGAEEVDHKFIGKSCYGNGHLYLISEFYEALLSGGDVPVTLESAQYAVRILLAAYRSNDTEVLI